MQAGVPNECHPPASDLCALRLILDTQPRTKGWGREEGLPGLSLLSQGRTTSSQLRFSRDFSRYEQASDCVSGDSSPKLSSGSDCLPHRPLAGTGLPLPLLLLPPAGSRRLCPLGQGFRKFQQ